MVGISFIYLGRVEEHSWDEWNSSLSYSKDRITFNTLVIIRARKTHAATPLIKLFVAKQQSRLVTD